MWFSIVFHRCGFPSIAQDVTFRLCIRLVAFTLCASLALSKSEMNHFTEEWERKYNHELMMSSEDCVTCNHLRKFATVGREASCISHCELLVPPGTTDEVCEDRCWKLRHANAITASPCMAMSLCPLPLPRAIFHRDGPTTVYRPLVTLLEDGPSAPFAHQVVSWARLSYPGIYVHALNFTGPSKRGQWTVADAALERGFAELSPLRLQIERACEVLGEDPALDRGFALFATGQHGLVARGIVQLCPELEAVVLVTYDTPHGGDHGGRASQRIRALPPPYNDPYHSLVQDTFAEAGFVRDPQRLKEHRASSFLAKLNMEGEGGAGEAMRGLGHLQKLVLLYGAPDASATPRWQPDSSPWFQTWGTPSGAEEELTVPALWRSEVYGALGLDALDLARRLVMERLEACRYGGSEWAAAEAAEEQNERREGWSGCREQVYTHLLPHLG